MNGIYIVLLSACLRENWSTLLIFNRRRVEIGIGFDNYR